MKSSFWRRFRRNKGAVFGLVVLALVALVTALGPLVAQYDPWDMAGMPFAAPLAEPGMPLGTDTAVAAAVARSAAGALDGALLAPALAYGASGEHEGFPGTVILVRSRGE